MAECDGQKTPNAWKLYDLTGNVWEWIEDSHDSHAEAAETREQNRMSLGPRQRRRLFPTRTRARPRAQSRRQRES